MSGNGCPVKFGRPALFLRTKDSIPDDCLQFPLTAHRSRLTPLDQGRCPRSPPQRPHSPGAAGPSAPVVSVVTHVKAGFFDEPDHWTGISHVLEHMFFKGTTAARRRSYRPGDKGRRRIPQRRDWLRSHQRTSPFSRLPVSPPRSTSSRTHCAIRSSTPDELARELQVIIQEAKRKRDTPGAVAHETLHEMMFDRHRIRRWRIGTEEQLARLTRDDLWTYYRSRYVPERTIVAITGSLDPDRGSRARTGGLRGLARGHRRAGRIARGAAPA